MSVMKKIAFVWLVVISLIGIILLSLLTYESIKPKHGCCSHHKGISHCENSKVICKDKTTSKKCRCF